jgi:hypothetical protein
MGQQHLQTVRADRWPGNARSRKQNRSPHAAPLRTSPGKSSNPFLSRPQKTPGVLARTLAKFRYPAVTYGGSRREKKGVAGYHNCSFQS